MLSFALRLRLSRRADHGRAHRRRHSIEHHDTLAAAERSIREPKVGKPLPSSPAHGRGFLMRQLRQRADTRQIDIGALGRERDATGWGQSSKSRIWNKLGVTAGREPAERL